MNWGYIADSEFDAMEPLQATNSAPPLNVANTWLNVTEPPVHEANLPGKTPLKYLIMMTDGKNTVGTEEWVARAGTQNWRRWVTGQPSKGELGDAVNLVARKVVSVHQPQAIAITGMQAGAVTQKRSRNLMKSAPQGLQQLLGLVGNITQAKRPMIMILAGKKVNLIFRPILKRGRNVTRFMLLVLKCSLWVLR